MKILHFPAETDSNFTYLDDIYERMSDDISKQYFKDRIMYSLTGDYGFISDMVKRTEVGKDFLDLLKMHQNVYIYGCGKWGKGIADIFGDECNISAFIDKRETGGYAGIPILPLEEFKYSGGLVVVSPKVEIPGILEDLAQICGVDTQKVIFFKEYYKRSQESIYFNSRILQPKYFGEGMIIDVGCYDGQDYLNGMKWENGFLTKREYLALEPDPNNCAICVEQIGKNENCKIINAGASDQEKRFKITTQGMGTNFFDEGDTEIQTVMLDKVIGEKKVSMIKMDVEGWECQALRGAEKIIKRNTPIITVSLYHKREDIWKIPKLLLELNPQYVFFIDHHTLGWSDTVLYALNREKCLKIK